MEDLLFPSLCVPFSASIQSIGVFSIGSGHYWSRRILGASKLCTCRVLSLSLSLSLFEVALRLFALGCGRCAFQLVPITAKLLTSWVSNGRPRLWSWLVIVSLGIRALRHFRFLTFHHLLGAFLVSVLSVIGRGRQHERPHVLRPSGLSWDVLHHLE